MAPPVSNPTAAPKLRSAEQSASDTPLEGSLTSLLSSPDQPSTTLLVKTRSKPMAIKSHSQPASLGSSSSLAGSPWLLDTNASNISKTTRDHPPSSIDNVSAASISHQPTPPSSKPSSRDSICQADPLNFCDNLSAANFEVARDESAWRLDQSENYKMSSSERGICLIINNVEFDDILSERKGSDTDAFRFKEIFKQLGFTVESKRNLTADKMKVVFKQVSSLCSRKHDALIVILLSHGSPSGVYGSDVVEMNLNDILTYFDNKRCKQMIGKPKVFIVQACRGDRMDSGVSVSDTQFFSQPDSQIYGLTQASQFTQNIESPKIALWSKVDKNRNPTRTDMLLCFSSQMGYVSTRNEEEGSWLGASLAYYLRKCARDKHIIEIFNMVSRDIRQRETCDGYKQVIEVTSIGFDKSLYFNPGLAVVDEQKASNRIEGAAKHPLRDGGYFNS